MKSVKMTSNGVVIQPQFWGKDLHCIYFIDLNGGASIAIPKEDLSGVSEELASYCSSRSIYSSTEPTDTDGDTITYTTDPLTGGTYVTVGDWDNAHTRNVEANDALSKLSKKKFKHRESDR